MQSKEIVLGFSDNPFMIGYDNRIFEGDEDLGFRFPEGNLVGLDSFVSLDFVIGDVKSKTGYPVILNIGDSSTSGWDGNKVFRGNENSHTPFFNYSTYSDILREHPAYQNAINAGVPGYTSLQGRKYLERLLKKFSRERVQVDYVTLYFGNNDSTYNQLEDKVRLEAKKESSNANGKRVTVRDYIKNIELMIETIREYGARPIVIVPPVHYDWEPGIRSDAHKEESLEALKQIEGTTLEKALQKAKEFYKKGEYKQATEMDRVLPRLKRDYRRALLQVCQKTKTPKIDIQKKIPNTDNEGFFADYCHPLPPTNKMIAEEIVRIRNRDIFHKPILKIACCLFSDLFKGQKKKNDGHSSNIYTLH